MTSQGKLQRLPPDPDALGKPAPRPRDAGTLILVRRDGPEPSILMGCRSRGHVFMPNKFAFPGGGVDAADARVRSHTPYDPDTEVSLKKMSARKSPASLGLAAIRETFEETGLRIGVASANRAQSASHSWRCFFEASTVPSLSALTFVARAITPPGQRRRFDARFFMADISAIHGDPEDFSAASGELTHLQWARLSEVRDLDLPFITRFILDFIEPRLHEPEKHHPVPFTYERYGRDHLDHL